MVAQVARQNGVAESCLYAWRKRLVGCGDDKVVPGRPQLILVMIEDALTSLTAAVRSETLPMARHATAAGWHSTGDHPSPEGIGCGATTDANLGPGGIK